MKRFLVRLLKGLTFTITLLAVLVFAIYSIAWFTFTKRAEIYIDAFWQNKAYVISGEKPSLSGYPLVPKASFSGSVEEPNGFIFSTPELTFTGFPAGLQAQTLEAPKGFKLSSKYLEKDLNLEYAFLRFVPPVHVPASTRREDIAEWQKKDRPIYIEKIIVQSGSIYAHGSGTLTLDENLQISGSITARVIGMEELFNDIAAEKGEKTIAIARSFFNMMSQIDEKTGEKYFETELKIQNRAIYFGPMRISGLPEIKWD